MARAGRVGRLLPLSCSIAACVAGCGRIGFEAIESDAAAPTEDAGESLDDAQVLPSYDYCREMPPLSTAAIIDGVLDGELPLQELVGEGWTGPANQPAGHGSRLAVAHRPGGVYVFVDVDNPIRVPAAVDDEEFCGDGIEIYLDGDGVFNDAIELPNYGDDTIQLIYAAPTDETQPSSRSARWRNFEKLGDVRSEFVVQPRAGGYVFEAFIVSDEVDPGTISSEAGGFLGFNLSLNLSYDDETKGEGICPAREGQYFLHIDETLPAGNAQLPFANNQAFCRPLLLNQE